MFAQFIIRIILVTLIGPLVLRDCGAVFITDPIKMTRSRCVGSISFLDDSQMPRVTFNRSVKRVRRLEAREVRVEGCGCFVLYKLRHFRGSSQQVGPGLSEVNLRWVRSVERTECEGYSETTKIKKTHQVRHIDTSTQQQAKPAERVETSATTVVVSTEATVSTTAEVTLSSTVTTSTVLEYSTSDTIATTRSTENVPAATLEDEGLASTKVKSSNPDNSLLIEQTTEGPMKPNPTSRRNINEQQSHKKKTSETKNGNLNKTLIIVKTDLFNEDLTATWTETYQRSPMSVNTVSQTTESGSVTHFVKTSKKHMNWEKTKSLSENSRNTTLVKSYKAFLKEITTEVNQQVDNTADAVFETLIPKGDHQHQKEKEEIYLQGDLKFDAIMTNNKIETDSDYVDAIDPITGAANDIQRESLEPKMSSLVSSISNSALKQRHPIVFILIVQLVLK